MSRASVIRLLLACAIGALVGSIWGAAEDGRPILGYVFPIVFVVAAYATAWTLGDER